MAPMRDGLDGENGLIGWQKQQARPLRTPLPLRFRPFSFRPRKPFQSPLALRAILASENTRLLRTRATRKQHIFLNFPQLPSSLFDLHSKADLGP